MATIKRTLVGAYAAAAVLAATPALAQELTVWHDLGDNGIAWFERLGEEFAKTHPGVTVTSVSYPTDQWFGRVIAALNTDTAPDLIYNNYERVIRIEDQTERVSDLSDVLAGVEDKDFLSEADLQVATYKDKMIILPIQRVQMGFGARKSWLDKVGMQMPATWEEAKAVADAFQTHAPHAHRTDDTFVVALDAANPRDLIHMLDLFTFGSGVRHTLIDPEGNIVVDEPQHAATTATSRETASTLQAPRHVSYYMHALTQRPAHPNEPHNAPAMPTAIGSQ